MKIIITFSVVIIYSLAKTLIIPTPIRDQALA